MSIGPCGLGANQMIPAANTKQIAMAANMLSVASMTLWLSTRPDSMVTAVSCGVPCATMASSVACPLCMAAGQFRLVVAGRIRPARLDQRGREGAGQGAHEVGEAGGVGLFIVIDTGHRQACHGNEEHHHGRSGEQGRQGHLQKGDVRA